jgi:acetyl-CoA synthetase/medium-chain acyl-CoA synthetase
MNASDAPEFFNFATDVFDAWAGTQPQRAALWCVDAPGGSEQRLSFAELAAASRRAANVFATAGLGRGDRVLVMLPRVPAWWIGMLGLIRLGAVPIPATPQLTARDVAYRVQTAAIRGMLTDADGARKAEGFEGVRLCVGDGPSGWLSWEAALSRAPATFESPRTRSTDPGIIYFTSATTGAPKMVLHTQASYGWAHRITGRLWLDLKPGDVHWNISDLGWAKAAWSSFFGPWHQGACVFALNSHGKFDPARTLDVLEHFPISTWCAPPTALRLLIRQPLEKRRFPRLRHCVTAGEPLNAEVFKLWRNATGLDLYEGYGQTETIILAGWFRSLGDAVRPGSMGRPTPGMGVALVDEAGREVPPDAEGEIAVRLKPQRPTGLFAEYWRSPEETAAHFRGEWYLTGDRARRDADGSLWFIGRKDDIIKSSGHRIGPFEVESVLLEHPAVLEAAVVGKPDPLRGQIVKAYVVLREGFERGPELARELQTHCRRLTAPYKYPREIEFVEELPKTISGKTRRFELRAKA